MKKYLVSVFVIGVAVALISWGTVGHKTIASVAESHLTPKAKAGIKALIGDTSIVDIAAWADQARSTSEYKYTGPWHYLEFTLGLNYPIFKIR